jgi:hypothetical protein
MNKILYKASVLASGCLVLAISIWSFGHRQLGGFDMSALIDTGWRMVSEQIPYHDFVLTTPVIFYLGAGEALKLFGVKWSAFVIAEILMAISGFLVQVYLLNQIIPWKSSILISFVCQALCSVVISYWWYNSITIMAACLFLTSAYVFVSQPTSRMGTIALWGTLTFLSLTKPNIAGSLAVLVFISLIVFTPHRLRIIFIYLASLVTFILLLFLLHISPFEVVKTYAELAKGRGTPSIYWFFNDKQLEYLITIPLIMLSLAPMAISLNQLKSLGTIINLKANLAITVASFVSGGISLLTNSDSNLVVGVPFFILASSIFVLQIPRQAQFQLTARKNFVWVVLVLCGIAAFFAGMMRWRVLYIGPESFYTDSTLVTIPNVPFFENFQVSPRARSVVTEIDAVLKQSYGNQEKWRNASVYFGARIEFSYAAFGITSPKYLPIWWHPNNSYAVIDTGKLIQAFLDHNFDICIFMLSPNDNQPDFGFLPHQIVDNIKNHYNRVDSSSIAVYYRDR